MSRIVEGVSLWRFVALFGGSASPTSNESEDSTLRWPWHRSLIMILSRREAHPSHEHLFRGLLCFAWAQWCPWLGPLTLLRVYRSSLWPLWYSYLKHLGWRFHFELDSSLLRRFGHLGNSASRVGLDVFPTFLSHLNLSRKCHWHRSHRTCASLQ